MVARYKELYQKKDWGFFFGQNDGPWMYLYDVLIEFRISINKGQ